MPPSDGVLQRVPPSVCRTILYIQHRSLPPCSKLIVSIFSSSGSPWYYNLCHVTSQTVAYCKLAVHCCCVEMLSAHLHILVLQAVSISPTHKATVKPTLVTQTTEYTTNSFELDQRQVCASRPAAALAGLGRQV